MLRFGDPHTLPTHVVFPHEYAATRRMIIRDFVFFGVAVIGIVATVGALFGG